MNEPKTRQTALQELANSGALCSDCGGLHVGKVDTAIISSSIAQATQTPIPWCSCAECLACKNFREALGRIIEEQSRLDPTPHCEDSL